MVGRSTRALALVVALGLGGTATAAPWTGWFEHLPFEWLGGAAPPSVNADTGDLGADTGDVASDTGQVGDDTGGVDTGGGDTGGGDTGGGDTGGGDTGGEDDSDGGGGDGGSTPTPNPTPDPNGADLADQVAARDGCIYGCATASPAGLLSGFGVFFAGAMVARRRRR